MFYITGTVCVILILILLVQLFGARMAISGLLTLTSVLAGVYAKIRSCGPKRPKVPLKRLQERKIPPDRKVVDEKEGFPQAGKKHPNNNKKGKKNPLSRLRSEQPQRQTSESECRTRSASTACLLEDSTTPSDLVTSTSRLLCRKRSALSRVASAQQLSAVTEHAGAKAGPAAAQQRSQDSQQHAPLADNQQQKTDDTSTSNAPAARLESQSSSLLNKKKKTTTTGVKSALGAQAVLSPDEQLNLDAVCDRLMQLPDRDVLPDRLPTADRRGSSHNQVTNTMLNSQTSSATLGSDCSEHNNDNFSSLGNFGVSSTVEDELHMSSARPSIPFVLEEEGEELLGYNILAIRGGSSLSTGTASATEDGAEADLEDGLNHAGSAASGARKKRTKKKRQSNKQEQSSSISLGSAESSATRAGAPRRGTSKISSAGTNCRSGEPSANTAERSPPSDTALTNEKHPLNPAAPLFTTPKNRLKGGAVDATSPPTEGATTPLTGPSRKMIASLTGPLRARRQASERGGSQQEPAEFARTPSAVALAARQSSWSSALAPLPLPAPSASLAVHKENLKEEDANSSGCDLSEHGGLSPCSVHSCGTVVQTLFPDDGGSYGGVVPRVSTGNTRGPDHPWSANFENRRQTSTSIKLPGHANRAKSGSSINDINASSSANYGKNLHGIFSPHDNVEPAVNRPTGETMDKRPRSMSPDVSPQSARGEHSPPRGKSTIVSDLEFEGENLQRGFSTATCQTAESEQGGAEDDIGALMCETLLRDNSADLDACTPPGSGTPYGMISPAEDRVDDRSPVGPSSEEPVWGGGFSVGGEAVVLNRRGRHAAPATVDELLHASSLELDHNNQHRRSKNTLNLFGLERVGSPTDSSCRNGRADSRDTLDLTTTSHSARDRAVGGPPTFRGSSVDINNAGSPSFSGTVSCTRPSWVPQTPVEPSDPHSFMPAGAIPSSIPKGGAGSLVDRGLQQHRSSGRTSMDMSGGAGPPGAPAGPGVHDNRAAAQAAEAHARAAEYYRQAAAHHASRSMSLGSWGTTTGGPGLVMPGPGLGGMTATAAPFTPMEEQTGSSYGTVGSVGYEGVAQHLQTQPSYTHSATGAAPPPGINSCSSVHSTIHTQRSAAYLARELSRTGTSSPPRLLGVPMARDHTANLRRGTSSVTSSGRLHQDGVTEDVRHGHAVGNATVLPPRRLFNQPLYNAGAAGAGPPNPATTKYDLLNGPPQGQHSTTSNNLPGSLLGGGSTSALSQLSQKPLGRRDTASAEETNNMPADHILETEASTSSFVLPEHSMSSGCRSAGAFHEQLRSAGAFHELSGSRSVQDSRFLLSSKSVDPYANNMPDDSGGELYSLTSVPRSSKSVQLPEPMIDERQIYVGGLPFKVTESEVRAYFEKHCQGTIWTIRFLRDPQTNLPKGVCFLKFLDVEAAKRALPLHGTYYQDRLLTVRVANQSRRSVTGSISVQTPQNQLSFTRCDTRCPTSSKSSFSSLSTRQSSLYSQTSYNDFTKSHSTSTVGPSMHPGHHHSGQHMTGPNGEHVVLVPVVVNPATGKPLHCGSFDRFVPPPTGGGPPVERGGEHPNATEQQLPPHKRHSRLVQRAASARDRCLPGARAVPESTSPSLGERIAENCSTGGNSWNDLRGAEEVASGADTTTASLHRESAGTSPPGLGRGEHHVFCRNNGGEQDVVPRRPKFEVVVDEASLEKNSSSAGDVDRSSSSALDAQCSSASTRSAKFEGGRKRGKKSAKNKREDSDKVVVGEQKRIILQ